MAESPSRGVPGARRAPYTEAEATALATEFDEAVRQGRQPAIRLAESQDHLLVLNILIRSHSLEACRRYAAADELEWGRFSMLDNLRHLVMHAPTEIDPCMPDRRDFFSATSDFLVCPRPGATRTVLVFTGVLQQFGGPLRLLHRWLARLNVSVIYLLDRRQNYYLGPMNGLGATLSDNVRSLQTIIREMGSHSSCCLGNSTGGFGALLFAGGLGANRVLAYSPPTNIRESLPRVRETVPNLEYLISSGGTVDLADLLTRTEMTSQAKIYFPADNAHDRDEAANVLAVPNVEVIPIAGLIQHNLIPHMVNRGLFGAHLDWLVGE